jgi:uncharacterized membrane protein YhaH (DUF805 family)
MQPSGGFGWFLKAIKRYAEFQGRSRRREFWYFVLFDVLINTVADILDRRLGIPFLSLVVTLVLLSPNIAVGIRRLHDTNRSGWWSLLPIVNIIFWFQDSDPSDNRFGPCPKPDSRMRGRNAQASLEGSGSF